MTTLTEIVRSFTKRIRNGRTNTSILAHMRSEVDELDAEIQNGNIGEDGILGESIDIIACALDMIFENYPDISEEELARIMQAKCEKWERKYS